METLEEAWVSLVDDLRPRRMPRRPPMRQAKAFARASGHAKKYFSREVLRKRYSLTAEEILAHATKVALTHEMVGFLNADRVERHPW